MLNKYGAGASRLAAAEEVVCEGEKTREERDAELRGEAVSLDECRGRQAVLGLGWLGKFGDIRGNNGVYGELCGASVRQSN